ncbi:MAG: trypsin-like peptidase domain-containing protein [Frankia sp.]
MDTDEHRTSPATATRTTHDGWRRDHPGTSVERNPSERHPSERNPSNQPSAPGSPAVADDPYAAYGTSDGPGTFQGGPPSYPPSFPAGPGTVGPGVPPTRRRRVAVGLAGLALVAGAAGGGVGVLASGGGGSSSTPSITTLSTSDSGSTTVKAATSGTIASAAAKIEPSVVTITVTGTDSSDVGSGIIVRSDGYILTNNHVIADGGTIKVQRYNGQNYTATVVGQDATDDLAVLKIDATGLPAATFADSSKITVGDLAVAVGSPLGLSNTVTSGVVSALNRTITTSESGSSGLGASGTGNSGATIKNAIQTDAPINPGNSGGALVNASGQVIGVTSAIASTSTSSFGQQSQSGSIGVGFAIPANTAVRIAAQLISSGSASSTT